MWIGGLSEIVHIFLAFSGSDGSYTVEDIFSEKTNTIEERIHARQNVLQHNFPLSPELITIAKEIPRPIDILS